MRRHAVMIAISLALAGACTEHLVLPPDKPDDGGASGGAPSGSGGRSAGSGGAFGSGGKPGSGGSGAPGTCGGGTRIKLLFESRREQIVLVVGRNMSMSTAFGNTGGTRMTAVQQAVREVVMANDRAVDFAYEDFPSPVTCSNQTACCPNFATVINPAPDNFVTIDEAINSCTGTQPQPGCISTSNSRPIADALRNVLTPSPGRSPVLPPAGDGRRRVILMVDGPPVCSSLEDAPTSCGNAKPQVAALQTNSVTVHVVPIGPDAASSECLRQMAQQGDPLVPPFAYPAGDPGQLLDSLSRIIDDAAQSACELVLLNGPTNANKISVDIENDPVPADVANGWSVQGSNSIVFHGAACRDLQNARDRDVHVWQCQ